MIVVCCCSWSSRNLESSAAEYFVPSLNTCPTSIACFSSSTPPQRGKDRLRRRCEIAQPSVVQLVVARRVDADVMLVGLVAPVTPLAMAATS